MDVCEKYLGVACWIRRITCDTSSAVRVATLREFQEDTPDRAICLRIVTSIRILNEAIDVPRCDSIFIANVSSTATERSYITAVQRISRATRIDLMNPHKIARAYVWTGNCDRDDIAALVWALKENDPQLPSKMVVRSSNYDRAVGNFEMVSLCHLELEEWKREFTMQCMSHGDLVELKVGLLIAHYAQTLPRCKETREVRLDGGGCYTFRAGRFARCILSNWVTFDRVNTRLTPEQKIRVEEACQWLTGFVEATRAHALQYKPSLAEKVEWLAEFYPARKPKWGETRMVEVMGNILYEFQAGKFVDSITANWVDRTRINTKLTSDQKARLESACTEWFPEWIEKARASTKTEYLPTTEDKIAWLLQYYANTKPKQSATHEVKLRTGASYTFGLGQFAQRILSNWLIEPRRGVESKLSAAQKKRLEVGCKWVREFAAKAQSRGPPAYKPSIDEKIGWLIEFFHGKKPGRNAELAIKLSDGRVYTFKVGVFVYAISRNWVAGTRRIGTKLDLNQKKRLEEGCEWLPME